MKLTVVLLALAISRAAFAGGTDIGNSEDKGTFKNDVRASIEFIRTCPEQFITYIDKNEGGPGAYCACPDDNISYIDKHEGGPGFYCQQ